MNDGAIRYDRWCRIGASIKNRLRDEGHEVIVVDIKDADIIADLSTAEGRQAVVEKIRDTAAGGLDGLVTCAGVGANVTNNAMIAQLNYFGTVEIIEGTKDLLQVKGGAVVLVSSTSAVGNQTPEFVDLLLAGESEKATEYTSTITGHDVYSGTKQGVTRWMRRHVVEYASLGVRMNAIAPGYTETPMNVEAEKSAEYGPAVRDFKASIPWAIRRCQKTRLPLRGFC
jgi:NAD(P)-dependent dehydrogenase (short-subunit alcohol dehydrogenase family)